MTAAEFGTIATIIIAVLAALRALAEFWGDKPMPNWITDITGDLNELDDPAEEED